MHFSAFIAIVRFYAILNDSILDIIDIGMPTRDGAILDVGSYDVNGNSREAMEMTSFKSRDFTYTGADFAYGPNVNVVVSTDNAWPFGANQFDIISSVSCLEHDDFFWETFLSMAVTLKPGAELNLGYLPSPPLWHPDYVL
jgi:SAM-dependent methyltransferase